MHDTGPLLLLTRPQAASERFAAALRARGVGFRPIISPAMSIALMGPLPCDKRLGGLIFTSAQGVRAWAALGGRRDLPAFAVGQATARAAAEAGIAATSSEGNADCLVAAVNAARPEGTLCHIRGKFARGDVAGRLNAAGLEVEEAILYDQPELAPNAEAEEALSGNGFVVAPIFSPRSAAILGTWNIEAPLLVAAMSDAVAKAAPAAHIKALTVAARPDSEAMLDSTAELLGFVAGIGEKTG